MAAGDIRNQPYATRAKEYVWSTLCEWFPRGISPTDVDGMVELNRCYFLFEGKTEGKALDTGQKLCLRRHLLDLPPLRAVYVVGTHTSLERVNVGTQLLSLRLAWSTGQEVAWSPSLPGAAIANITRYFVRDAEAGRLNVAAWSEQYEHECRPFGDAA